MTVRISGKGRTSSPEDMRIQAVLCDLDGTLVDTEVILYQTWVQLVAEAGHDFRKTFAYGSIIGRTDLDCARIVIEHYGLKREPAEWYEQYRKVALGLMAEGLRLRPGADEFLERVAGAGIPLALVTSSVREHAEFALRRFDLLEAFDLIVTADTPGLTARKPDPAPYLLAATTLGADPRRCLVFEDSPAGVEAGLAAGCYVYGVPHQHSLHAGLARAHKLLWTIDCWQPGPLPPNWT